MTTRDAWRQEAWQAPDGNAMSVWHRPGARPGLPHLHLAHATGLNGLSYRGLLDPLHGHAHLWAWDMRGHGSSEIRRPLSGWTRYYADLVALVNFIGEPLILAGHSVGGMASAAVASMLPAPVRGLLLLDPVLFAGPKAWQLRLAQWLGGAGRMPLAVRARRRRDRFADAQQALAAYRGRSIFSAWPDAWLADYIRAGFHADNDGIVLNCAPDTEARSFALTETTPFRHVRRISCPVTVLLAARGSTTHPAALRRFVRRVPQARIETVPDSSHMLPFESPELVRAALQSLLGR